MAPKDRLGLQLRARRVRPRRRPLGRGLDQREPADVHVSDPKPGPLGRHGDVGLRPYDEGDADAHGARGASPAGAELARGHLGLV